MVLLDLLISAMPLTRDPLWERFMSDLTAIKYLGLLCLLCALWRCLAARKLPPLWMAPQALGLLALCVWAAASWLTLGPPLAWDQSPLLSYVSFVVLLLITLSLVDTWPRLGNVLAAMSAAVAVASLYILREWQKYHAVYRDFRPGWVTGDPNYFTASALVALPLALAFSGHATRWWLRYAARACALLTLAAIALAASRGGLLGLAVLLGYLAWRRRRLRQLTLAVVACVPLMLLWSNSPLNRLLHPTASDTRSTDTRLALWQAGLRMIAAHPVTGIGLGNFKVEVQDYAVSGTNLNLDHIAHNAYLEIAAEMGLPALALYAFTVISGWRSLARLQPSRPRRLGRVSPPPSPPPAAAYAPSPPAPAPPQPAPISPAWASEAALGLQAGLLGFSVSAFFLSAQYTKLFWMLLAVSASIPALVPSPAALSAGEPAFAPHTPFQGFAERQSPPAAVCTGLNV
jgi:O-antigen ligase